MVAAEKKRCPTRMSDAERIQKGMALRRHISDAIIVSNSTAIDITQDMVECAHDLCRNRIEEAVNGAIAMVSKHCTSKASALAIPKVCF